MTNKVETLGQRGRRLIDALKLSAKFTSDIITDPIKLKNLGERENWLSFVTFPKEITGLTQDTYISPGSFLENLGEKNPQGQELLGDTLGTIDHPLYEKRQHNFEFRVLNGMTNKYAMKIAEMASHGFGFEKAIDRAEYQDSMFSLAKPMSKAEYKMGGIRIYDDCGASADSIYGYLYALAQTDKGQEKMRQGVRLDLFVATPQAVLFLKKFSEQLGFPLEINVGYMAFGLNEKNYITYPDELLQSGQLDEHTVAKLEKFRNKDGNVYVVGDMGNAQKGISKKDMIKIRLQKLNPKYLFFNDTRTDPHGDHENKKEKVEKHKSELTSLVDFVYFARGGYLPYHFDWILKTFAYDLAEKTVYRAARKDLDSQYGVAFRNE